MKAEYSLAFLFHSLPPLMAQNLSIPLAFACLLHLANEKVGRPGKHRVLQSAYRSFPLVFSVDASGRQAPQGSSLQAWEIGAA